MKIAVVGLGNPILTDDAVGIRISETVQQKIKRINLTKDSKGEKESPAPVSVRVFQDEVGGWDIIDLVEGFDILILIDAMTDRALKPGELRWYPGRVFSSIRLSGIHSMDVFSALEFAGKHGIKVPQKVLVLGVGVKDIHTFSEQCTPAVAEAIPKGAAEVIKQIRALIKEPHLE